MFELEGEHDSNHMHVHLVILHAVAEALFQAPKTLQTSIDTFLSGSCLCSEFMHILFVKRVVEQDLVHTLVDFVGNAFCSFGLFIAQPFLHEDLQVTGGSWKQTIDPNDIA